MTYADAVLTIQDYCQKGEQCMITVHSNIEGINLCTNRNYKWLIIKNSSP